MYWEVWGKPEGNVVLRGRFKDSFLCPHLVVRDEGRRDEGGERGSMGRE